MVIKGRIIQKINDIPTNLLPDLEKHIDYLIQNNANTKKCSTERQLEKLKIKMSLDNKDITSLAENLKNDWDIIIEKSILTEYFITILREFRNPQTDSFLVKRIKCDSRTGGYFEDNFNFFLKSYLYSKPDLWSNNNSFQEVEIIRNQPIPIPGERNKKEPDILIRDHKTQKPIYVIELKAGYTKRSLIREYNSYQQIWTKLDKNINFLYIIFSASSKIKTNTYKKVGGCRVVCYDFKTDKDSQIKGITPQIVDSIETIFEEIYETIIRFKKESRSTSKKNNNQK